MNFSVNPIGGWLVWSPAAFLVIYLSYLAYRDRIRAGGTRTTTARTFGADTFLIAQVASPGRVSRRELQQQLQRNPAIQRIELTALERLAGGMVGHNASRFGEAGLRG